MGGIKTLADAAYIDSVRPQKTLIRGVFDLIDRSVPIFAESFGASSTATNAANKTALDAWVLSGLNLAVGPGTFTFTSSVTLPSAAAYLRMRGAGPNVTIFKTADGSTPFVFPSGSYCDGFLMSDLSLRGQGSGVGSSSGIRFPSTMARPSFNVRLENLYISDFGGNAILDEIGVFTTFWSNVQASDCGGHLFDLIGSNTQQFSQCYGHALASGKAIWRVRAGRPVFSGCNGVDNADYWGIFGNTVGEDGNTQYSTPVLIGCNIEDYKVTGIINKNSGIHFINTSVVAPSSGTVKAVDFQNGTLYEKGTGFPRLLTKGAAYANSCAIHTRQASEVFAHVTSNDGAAINVRDDDNSLTQTVPSWTHSAIPAVGNVANQTSHLSVETFLRVPRYAKAALPNAIVTGQIALVTDETGGATLAFSDGSNWRRVQDRNVVS